MYQEKAYTSWQQCKVETWWQKVMSSDEPPTKEHVAFLECVITRCDAERDDLQRHAALQLLLESTKAGKKKKKTKKHTRKEERQRLSEPRRIGLFGIPGAGKSSCLKLIRSYFEEVLGWVDGDEYQFLASQNTMASLINGQTLHHWSTIPVNAQSASSKKVGKGADGDIDALFQKVQGMRWLVIDEVSTASLRILDLLDSYLRRTCKRHPYARHNGCETLFGGINIIFCGDLWQLPPVKGKSMFSNPFKSGLATGEQKIMKMFWMIKDPIHHLFELTRSLRARDEWLKEMLEADRYGCETWEMYCFVHGLPTRNPGSWLPSANGPTCGQPSCARLAETWSTQWRDVSWEIRRSAECEICQKERERRCCIISGNARNTRRYLEDPFTDSPFVHPFRAPSYHAQHLRSISFAKKRQRRILWIAAFDKFVNSGKDFGHESAQKRKEKWLQYHERFTNGIPGLFPCVLGLPVRFTDSPTAAARAQGIFKHARGILVGWELPEEEQQRLDLLGDSSEVVLKKRPNKLFLSLIHI